MTNSAVESVFIILEHCGDVYQTSGIDVAAVFFTKSEKTEVSSSKLAGYTTLDVEDRELISELISQVESRIREHWPCVMEMKDWATGLRIRGPYPMAEFARFAGSIVV